MRVAEGLIAAIQLDSDGQLAAWIECSLGLVPAPGQYTLAQAFGTVRESLATPLFPVEAHAGRFLAAPPLPLSWSPGMELSLRGPLGNGFALPERLHNLALAALGETVARLLPLVGQFSASDIAVALFTDAALPALPAAIEAYPLAELAESLAWADFLVMDLPLASLPELRGHLGMGKHGSLPCPAQALVLADMPCGAVADCGVCAISARRGWKLACKDGPVFNLNELEW